MDISKDFKLYANSLGVNSLTLHDYQSHVSKEIISHTNAPNIINMTPNIVEENQMNIALMDVFSRLMKDRTIFFGTGVDDHVSNIVVAQLLYLESVESKSDINMYVNSPGGGVYAGLAIKDTMDYVQPDVGTTVTAIAASMGAILQSSGTKGKRRALKHSRIMIHQPLGGTQGQSSDIEISTKQILLLKKELYDILAENTGKDYDKIHKDCDRDYWMTSAEAKEYGMIDEIITKRK